MDQAAETLFLNNRMRQALCSLRPILRPLRVLAPRAVRGPAVAKAADARGHRDCPGDAGDEGVERAEVARGRETAVNDATFQKWESLPSPHSAATITRTALREQNGLQLPPFREHRAIALQRRASGKNLSGAMPSCTLVTGAAEWSGPVRFRREV